MVSVAARQAVMFVLLFSALEIVPAGRSSILIWTASLWTVPIAVIFIGERMNRMRTLGLTVGIAGVLLVFEPAGFDWTDGRVVVGHVMLLSAAMVQAAVSVHVRHHSWTSTPLGLLPWQMLTAAVPVLAVALVTDGLPTIAWDTATRGHRDLPGNVRQRFRHLGPAHGPPRLLRHQHEPRPHDDPGHRVDIVGGAPQRDARHGCGWGTRPRVGRSDLQQARRLTDVVIRRDEPHRGGRSRLIQRVPLEPQPCVKVLWNAAISHPASPTVATMEHVASLTPRSGPAGASRRPVACASSVPGLR